MSSEPTFEEVRDQIRKICDDGGLQRPNTFIDTRNGETLAVWFDPRLVMAVGPTDEPNPGSLAEDEGFLEAVEAVAWICSEGDFPAPDCLDYDPEGGRIRFEWTNEFDAMWNVDELVESYRAARERAAHQVDV